jgi:hypothetical protein
MRSGYLVRLKERIEIFGEEATKEFLLTFSCTDGDEVERYLHNTAIMDEKRSLSRTYLYISRDGKEEILAYFTIAPKYISMDGSVKLSSKLTRTLNPDKKKIAQCRILGQLGRSDISDKGTGKVTLGFALCIMNRLNVIEGCRAVRLDCKPDDKLISYYKSFGFIDAGLNSDNDLHQMVLIMKDPIKDEVSASDGSTAA